jgi:hypothetical protein
MAHRVGDPISYQNDRKYPKAIVGKVGIACVGITRPAWIFRPAGTLPVVMRPALVL